MSSQNLPSFASRSAWSFRHGESPSDSARPRVWVLDDETSSVAPRVGDRRKYTDAAPPAARLDNDEDAWERAKETLPFLADIQPADVIKALKSATRGAAQDCMGWRVESLQALCAFPDAIEALTSLIRALARGDLHDSATELLTRARLVAPSSSASRASTRSTRASPSPRTLVEASSTVDDVCGTPRVR